MIRKPPKPGELYHFDAMKALWRNPCTVSDAEENSIDEQFVGHYSYMEKEQQEAYFDKCRATWPRCLEFKTSSNEEDISHFASPKYFRVQACVDRFYWHEIVNVKHYK